MNRKSAGRGLAFVQFADTVTSRFAKKGVGMGNRLNPDDLPVADGRVYHLDLAPEELARHVIVVGDPDRVPVLAEAFLATREVDRFHRGFRTITGVTAETGQRVSFVTSGIGAPSTEIVLNELAALNEVDFTTMTRREQWQPLTLVRLGTSGGLNPATPVGTLVLTDYVVGLDNTALYYDIPLPDEACALLEERVRSIMTGAELPGARFAGRIAPYAARSDRGLLASLTAAAGTLGLPWIRGLTISSAGFFAEQGRGVARVGTTHVNLLDALEHLASPWPGFELQNMEMEAGFFLHFLGGLGYRAAAVCVVINQRTSGVFMADYRRQVLDGARLILRAFKECETV
ncbi:phosphorylase family protein [Geobacter anodireducens]